VILWTDNPGPPSAAKARQKTRPTAPRAESGTGLGLGRIAPERSCSPVHGQTEPWPLRRDQGERRGNVDLHSDLRDWSYVWRDSGDTLYRHVRGCARRRRRAERWRTCRKIAAYFGQLAVQFLLLLLVILTIYSCWILGQVVL
jgi:hypothetical protein